jgi:hypothetical protein
MVPILALLDITQEYRKLYSMKATLEIPDDLYRRVKARSALEGRPLRAVATQLFQNWLAAPPLEDASVPVEPTPAEFSAAPWLAITQPYLTPGMSHDMHDIRAAIARGWAGEGADERISAGPKP